MTISPAGPTDEQLQQLLHICEDYFRHTGPATRAELDAILHQHGITGGPGWFIDMLGLTRLQLQNQHETTIGKPEH